MKPPTNVPAPREWIRRFQLAEIKESRQMLKLRWSCNLWTTLYRITKQEPQSELNMVLVKPIVSLIKAQGSVIPKSWPRQLVRQTYFNDSLLLRRKMNEVLWPLGYRVIELSSSDLSIVTRITVCQRTLTSLILIMLRITHVANPIRESITWLYHGKVQMAILVWVPNARRLQMRLKHIPKKSLHQQHTIRSTPLVSWTVRYQKLRASTIWVIVSTSANATQVQGHTRSNISGLRKPLEPPKWTLTWREARTGNQ